MRELPHTRSCFVCGESNAFGLKLRFETDRRTVQAHFRPRPEHVGFRGVVHGGIIAAVLDEAMVWACAVRMGQFGFCARLNVRFLNPLPPDEESLVTGELTANRSGRIFEARAVLRNFSGAALAEAGGKYRPIKSADVLAMVTDFVGDAKWVLGERA